MEEKQACETCSISCHGRCHFDSSLILLIYSEISTLQESPSIHCCLGNVKREISCVYFPHLESGSKQGTRPSCSENRHPSFFETGTLKARVMWILSWPNLTKSSTDTLVSRSHDCPGTNCRYSAEKACLEQTEVWSYNFTAVLVDPNVSFNEMFWLDQLQEPCLLFHRNWLHSRSLLCSSINDVKTQLPQHCKGRELDDTETALGIQVASFVW